MKKMVPKKYLVRKISDYVGALFLVFLIIFIWQLSRSPIPLPFLKPYIIRALSHDNFDYEVSVEAVNLELVRSIQPIKIIAKDVLYRRTDNSIIIKAPRTSISFSIRALLRGIISPSSIRIDKPSVVINTNYGVDKEEATQLSINEKKIGYYFDVFERFMERFNSSNFSYPETYIDEIIIKNAELEFHEVDLGRKWVFSEANYIFDRHKTYIELGLDALLDLGDTSVPFDLDLNFYHKKNELEFKFSFADMVPSTLIDNIAAGKENNNFYEINLPVSGKIDIVVDFDEILANRNRVSRSLDTAITKFDFQFEGGDGSIAFSDDKEFNYDISSFLLKGSIDSGLNNIKIENADFNLGSKKTTVSLDISGVKKLLLENSIKDLRVLLKTDIAKLPFEELPRYWPRYIAEDAWLWVRDGIYGGYVSDASFSFEFVYNPKTNSLGFNKLSGVGYINDASLNYLEGMPHVHHAYGKAEFFNDRISIKIDKGTSDGNVIVTGGHVILSDLDKYNNFIDIELAASSSIADSIRLINNPPLKFAKEMGIEPDSIIGEADTVLKLKFELKKDLEPEDVSVKVVSDLRNVKIREIVKDKVVSAEKLKLKVDNDGLFVEGDVVLDGINIGLEWTRAFVKPYHNKYRVSFLFDENIKKRYGIDTKFLSPPYFYGNAYIVGEISEIGNKITADIRADLIDNLIDYSFLGLVKKRGEAGKVNFTVNIVNEKVKSISDIMFAKDDLEVKAFVELDKKGSSVKNVDILSVKGPRTDAKARIEIGNGKQPTKINISGNSFDVSKLFEAGVERAEANLLDKKERAAEKLKSVSDIDINIAVNSLWTNRYVPITNFAGNVSLRNGIGINEVRLVGNYSYNRDLSFKFEYLPHADGEHMINVSSNDAGATLKALRLYDYMEGGVLLISARIDREGKIIGHARVRNFNIRNTNLLSRVLTVASLTGFVNMLRGNGIAFSHFDAPFTFYDGRLSIHEARAFGNVLGITADGYYDYNSGDLNFTGLIAPAYSINRFLARIPIIGSWLSGQNSAVFAANYRASGNIENPNIRIYTLSTITPNFLRNLFVRENGSEKD